MATIAVVIAAIVETRDTGIDLRFKNEYVKNLINVQPNTPTEKKYRWKTRNVLFKNGLTSWFIWSTHDHSNRFSPNFVEICLGKGDANVKSK